MIINSNHLCLLRHLIHSSCRHHNRRHPSLHVCRRQLLSTVVSVDRNNKSDEQIKEEVIKIPKRIERGPTDILRALAGTVQRDLTGPDYRFVDDPFLTPLSNNQKRLFSLSRESGKRAAKYVFDEFPELFIRDVSEPKIDAFTYKELIDESVVVDEIDILQCIARKEVNNAIQCFKNMTRDKKPMSAETVQKLLELVCFYNCDEPPDMDFLVEKSYAAGEVNRSANIWKDNGFAEQLFASIEQKTSQTYCTLIQGLVKFSQSVKADHYYKEAKELGLKLNIETYNGLIKVAPMLRESSDSRWLYMEDVLNDMKSCGVRPNLHTMNNMLEVVTRFGAIGFSHKFAKKILSEMVNKMGIEPSLATYYHILNVFAKDKSPNFPILYEIMDKIDGKEFTICDLNDVNFFTTAMFTCHSKLNDKSIAYRIHRLYSLGKNSKLMGNFLNETKYFQRFCRILCATEDVDVFMTDFYDKYVPNVYIPEPTTFLEILQMIELYEAFRYLPKLREDFKSFDYRIDPHMPSPVITDIQKILELN
ncbi:protein PTCD3 homolog, mitochondrial-like [Oppia nitens]|uniref:protein PTCD3 homolog, mitochondrial-like n=1 Tax=Oppia nitens TaxID=1686743 RepID=UPI0023DAC929|nr:protein PTCD3 homolog, mitochondrial-like [Oppia nitens]